MACNTVNIADSVVMIDGIDMKPYLVRKGTSIKASWPEDQVQSVEMLSGDINQAQTPSSLCTVEFTYQMHADSKNVVSAIITAAQKVVINGKVGGSNKSFMFEGSVKKKPDFAISGDSLDNQTIIFEGVGVLL